MRRPDDFSSASEESSLQIQPKSTSESVSSSVGLDVWRLRSILRLSHVSSMDSTDRRIVDSMQSAFAVYDEKFHQT